MHDASTQVSTLVRGEIELAKMELKATVRNGGAGLGFFVAAAVLLVFALTFGFIALAEGLVAAHIWRWAAYLMVFGLLVLVVALCALLGIRHVKRVRPPERAIAEGKQTLAMLKRPDGHAAS